MRRRAVGVRSSIIELPACLFNAGGTMHRVEKVRESDPVSHPLPEVLSLTARLFSTDQSHCENGLRSRHRVHRWAREVFHGRQYDEQERSLHAGHRV